MIQRPDNLIVTRAGKRSLHPEWIEASAESINFDVLVAAYDQGAPKISSSRVTNVFIPGKKVEGIRRIIVEHRDIIMNYRNIAFIDDDISANPATLSKCFELGARLELKLWQPALTQDSHYTYAGLVQNKHYEWRYVNFVEMMCPFFTREKLDEIKFVYELGYESGIDLIWCNVGTGDAKRSFAVLDCCPVRHTRPVGGEKERNGFVDGRRYEHDIELVLKQFALPWLSCVPYACVTPHGRVVTSRLEMFARSISLMMSIPMNQERRLRTRAVLTHWKHLLTRPAANCHVDHVAADAPR